MKDWFAGLEPRERQLIISGGVVLLVMLLYLLVWEPIAKDNESLKSRYQNSQHQ